MKRGIALLLCLFALAGFAACGGGEPENPGTDSALPSTVTDSGAEKVSTSSGGASVGETEDTVPNLVLACDQHNRRIVLYDLDLLDRKDGLDKGEIWSLDAGYAADMKYREGTVFGDVVLVAGLKSGIYAYPEKTPLFVTENPGNNPHAVELLPSGNLVVANSDGNSLRLFPASEVLNGKTSQEYREYTLKGAHGLLWDPQYGVLWALGDDELAAYLPSGSGTEEVLKKVGGMGALLPSKFPGGHDLSADLTDVAGLYLTTNKGALRFNKETGKFDPDFPQSRKIPSGYLKALSNNPNGNLFFVQTTDATGTAWADKNIAGWCSDRIGYVYKRSRKIRKRAEAPRSNRLGRAL